MMNTRKMAIVLLIFASLLAGCGGTGGKNSATTKTFRINLGLAMQDDFYEAIELIVYSRHRYVDSGDAHSSPNNLELITDWRPRFIFDDEQELGIVTVWSRILLFWCSNVHSRTKSSGRTLRKVARTRAEKYRMLWQRARRCIARYFLAHTKIPKIPVTVTSDRSLGYVQQSLLRMSTQCGPTWLPNTWS